MTVHTAAGSRFYIGSVQSIQDPDLANYETETNWVEVGEVEDLGDFGDQANQVTFTALANRRVRKFKGSFDAGTLAVTAGNDQADDGQQAMIAALPTDLSYNFKVELNDAETLSGTPTTLYFAGQVLSKQMRVGNVENVVRRIFNVGVNSSIVEVAPT